MVVSRNCNNLESIPDIKGADDATQINSHGCSKSRGN